MKGEGDWNVKRGSSFRIGEMPKLNVGGGGKEGSERIVGVCMLHGPVDCLCLGVCVRGHQDVILQPRSEDRGHQYPQGRKGDIY